ncbi:phage integrase N-terminal SAM-like domain-containing protein [Companilactobacillus zhongbaensis]|uniref:phage integrase N-terminal SAM-like domain-containing protein n=1 Tax=Companilactobacillus zhongbaensis TaxID=2486009 RepID=UPI000F774536|nr:phage integrase N-terminal SAM-like domain-containing protein [Companilactobacillus zhongbaensis]
MTKIPYITGFNAYLKTRHISKRAHDEYLNSLHDFMDYLIEHDPEFKVAQDTQTISDVDVLEYKTFMQKDLQHSPSTINKVLSNLNIYFKYLFANKLIDDIPTLNIVSLKVPTQDNFPTNIFLQLDDYLLDPELNIYTRLLILIISKGYHYQDALADGFYQTFGKLKFSKNEQRFIAEYRNFISPWQLHWHSKNLFLSRNKGAKSPLLSTAALHRDLKKDSDKLQLELTPKKLYTTYILILLSKKELTVDERKTIDQLSTSSFLYYRRLLRETDFEI